MLSSVRCANNRSALKTIMSVHVTVHMIEALCNWNLSRTEECAMFAIEASATWIEHNLLIVVFACNSNNSYQWKISLSALMGFSSFAHTHIDNTLSLTLLLLSIEYKSDYCSSVCRFIEIEIENEIYIIFLCIKWNHNVNINANIVINGWVFLFIRLCLTGYANTRCRWAIQHREIVCRITGNGSQGNEIFKFSISALYCLWKDTINWVLVFSFSLSLSPSHPFFVSHFSEILKSTEVTGECITDWSANGRWDFPHGSGHS